MSNSKSNRSPQGYWFAFILYPHEDERHEQVLKYIKDNPMLYQKWCAVEHDLDLEDDVDYCDVSCLDDEEAFVLSVQGSFDVLKKKHMHVLVRTDRKMTTKAFLERWSIPVFAPRNLCFSDGKRCHLVQAISYVELVSDSLAYIQYMAHIDFRSMADFHKHQYPASAFIGTPDLISSALNKTDILSNWQLLQAMWDTCQASGLREFLRQASEIQVCDSVKAFDLFRAFQGLALKADSLHERSVYTLQNERSSVYERY